MYYIVKYAMPFIRKTKEAVISADINVENGKIVLNNANFESRHSVTDIDTFQIF